MYMIHNSIKKLNIKLDNLNSKGIKLQLDTHTAMFLVKDFNNDQKFYYIYET